MNVTIATAKRVVSLLIFFLLCCCSEKKIPLEEETVKILQLHEAQRGYFNKDSITFTDQFSDTFISVNKRLISKPEKEVAISRCHRYFFAVEFVKWDDVSPPVVKFSDDGSMAYTMADKIVTVPYPDEKGNLKTNETHFPRVAIYKKYGNEWKIDAVVSTNKPTTTDP